MGRQESLMIGPQVLGASSFFSSAFSSVGVGFSSSGAAGPWAAAGDRARFQASQSPRTNFIHTLLK